MKTILVMLQCKMQASVVVKHVFKSTKTIKTTLGVNGRHILSMEYLKNMQTGRRLHKQQRAKQSNWSFYQLRQFATYKAKRVNIDFVNTANTRRKGRQCGYTEKANRKSRDVFFCMELGYSAMAGYNVAKNIAY